MKGKSRFTAVKLAVFGVVLAVAGIIVFAASFPYGHATSAYSARYREELNVDKTLSLEGVDTIAVTSAIPAEIVPAAGNDITVKAGGMHIRTSLFGKLNQIVEVKNGGAVIDFNEQWGLSIGFNFAYLLSERTAKLEVGIPESYAGSLTLKAVSESMALKVDNVFSSASLTLYSGVLTGRVQATGDVTLDTSSGTMDLTSVAAGGKLSARLSSGRLNAGTLTAAGNVDLDVSSGTMSFQSVSAGGTAGAHLSSGKLTTDSLACTSLTAKVSSGAMSLGGVDCTRFVSKLSSGSLTLNFAKAVSGTVKVSSGAMLLSMPRPSDVALKLTGDISSGKFVDDYCSNATYRDDFTTGIGNYTATDALAIDANISSGTIQLTAI